MGDEDEFNITEEIDIDDIQLARNFPVGVYTTVILPFSVNTANLEGVDSILVFGGMTYDENNKLAVVMDVVWENTRDDVDLEAYTPYLVRTTGEKIGVLGSVTLEKTQEAKVQQDGWEFCGVYANKTWKEGDPEIGVAYGYAASSDEALGVSVGDFVKVAAGAYIRPLHAYLIKLNSAGIAPNGSYVRKSSQSLPDKMSIVIVDGKKGGEGLHTTSIGKHNTRASEFRMNFVPSIYDLKGRKVGNGRKAKGVYLNK